jgi:hypothetical protein
MGIFVDYRVFDTTNSLMVPGSSRQAGHSHCGRNEFSAILAAFLPMQTRQ